VTTAQWRTLTYVLAVIFLLLLALVVVLVLSRTNPGTGSTPTPSGLAGASATPIGTGGPSPTQSATASVAASASAEASPSASPAASPAADVPAARAVIRGLGVDDPDSPQAVPRVIVFTSEGGDDVAVKLQEATGGKVELCLYPGTLADPLGDPACLKTTGSTLTGRSKGKKPFTWTVTVAGVKKGNTPAVDLRLDWAAHAPRLQMDDIRLQGTGAEPYDGVAVELAPRASAGSVALAGSWGDELPFRARIVDRETDTTLAEDSGDAAGVELSADLEARQRSEVRLAITAPLVATPVLADLVLTWP
jgi:hypothetical protein